MLLQGKRKITLSMQQVSLLAVAPLKANKTARGAVYAHKRLLSKYICTVDVHTGIIIDSVGLKPGEGLVSHMQSVADVLLQPINQMKK